MNLLIFSFCSEYWEEWWMDIVKYNNSYTALQNWEWTNLGKNWIVRCQLLEYVELGYMKLWMLLYHLWILS